MFYILPTKKGIGVEIWGTRNDLETLYDVFARFWGEENNYLEKGFETRDKIISGFAYALRKGYEGSRLVMKNNHFSTEDIEYFGTQLSWVHVLFSINALRYNSRFFETTKFEISIFLQFEYWLENAMNEFDEIGAKFLIPFITDGIHIGNEHLYLYMRSIDIDYLLTKGGKVAFRQLPNLLNRAIIYTEEYKSYLLELEKDAKKLGCKISELEINDDEVNYEKIKW